MNINIRENSFVGLLAARKLGATKVAIVIGNTIYLYATSRTEFLSNKRWLLHELKHIEQFHRYGFFTFIFRYLLETIRSGYYMNRFEIEAREAETRDDTPVFRMKSNE